MSLDNLTYIQKIILQNRIPEDSDINLFINNKLDFMHDLNKLKDIKKGSDLILQHMKNNNHIVSVTDYDADGINSAAVVHKSFTKLFNYSNFETIVNKRKYGNGINDTLAKNILECHKQNKIDLIITSDHASSDQDRLKILRDHGIDIVLTDHHQIPKNNYPKAANAFINPEREDCDYNMAISGCFVVFLVMVKCHYSLYGIKDINTFNELLPHVAVTTISDVMPLDIVINRYAVKTGLHVMNSLQDPRWGIIKNRLGIGGQYNYTEIGFKLAPLINTANRLDAEDIAFTMLTSDNIDEIKESVSVLLDLTSIRKSVQKKMLISAMEQVGVSRYKNSIVSLLDTNAHINGIVAAMVGNYFHKPAVCFLDSTDGIISGSGRGIVKDFDIYKAFGQINEEDSTIFIKYGGHKGAVGCSIHKDKLDRFKELFDYYSEQQLSKLPKFELKEDLELSGNLLNNGIVREIDRLAPYGQKWKEPIFKSKLKIKKYFKIQNMLKIVFVNSLNVEFQGLYFFNGFDGVNADNFRDMLNINKSYDVYYTPTLNNFANMISLQLNIKKIDIGVDNG